MNKFSCSSTASNVGAKQLCDNNLTVIRRFIVCPAGYEISTEANALLQSTWTTAIRTTTANRIYPFPLADSITPEMTDDVYQEFPLSGAKFVKDGMMGLTINLNINKALARKLRTFNNRPCSVFLVDENGNILGWSDDGTKVKAFNVQELRIKSQTLPDGTAVVETPVKLVLKDASEWNDYGVVIQPTWNPLELDGVYDVVVEIVSSSSTSLTVRVNIDSFAVTDPNGQITGLVKADFALKDDTPSAETITTTTDNGDGTYTHAFSTLGADNYTIDLVACSAISLTDIFIESTGPDTFTI